MRAVRIDNNWLASQPALCFAVDESGHVRSWNAALQETTGVAARKAAGSHISEVLGAEAASLVERARDAGAARQSSGLFVSPVYGAAGEWLGCWVRLGETSAEPGSAHTALLDRMARVAAGDLDARMETASLEGGEAEVAACFNRMLDTLVPPLRAAARALDQIARGSSPDFLTEDYSGQFNNIKASINQCVAVMYGLHNEIQDLVEAIKAGRLEARGNDWDFDGRWRDLITGLNELIDSFMQPYQMTAEYVNAISHGRIPEPIATRYRGDFNLIRRNLNVLIQTVNALTEDVNNLCTWAVAGQLDHRADPSRHGGTYRALVQGMNDMLDGVVVPLTGTARVLSAVAAGDLTVRLEGDYRGFYAKLQEDINKMSENLQSSLQQIQRSAEEVGSSSEDLTRISSEMANAASDTASRAQGAAAAGQTVAAEVRSLASGAEKTRESMRGIAEHTTQLFQATEQAADRADMAFRTISRASEAGSAIGAVINTIGSVAAETSALSTTARKQAEVADSAARGFGVVADEVKRLSTQIAEASETAGKRVKDFQVQVRALQGLNEDAASLVATAAEMAKAIDGIYRLAFHTGLVAINAAVEAARASDSGVRFGAVATEIAQLAQKTTGAATDVTQKLGAIRTGTTEAVDSIRIIVETVRQLRQSADAIAASASERVRTAEAMASAATRGAAGAGKISDNVTGVAAAASQTTRGAEDTAREAAALASMAEQLSELVIRFRV